MNILKKHQPSEEAAVPESKGQTFLPPDFPADIAAETDVELLVEKARAGDDEAFGQIVSRYERFVFHVAQRVLKACGGSGEQSEDVAQMAFLKAWRSLEGFRGECAFTSWLYRIVANCARDLIRAEARRPTVSLTQIDPESDEPIEIDVPVTEGEEVPEFALERKEAIRQVRLAIQDLPKDMRQVVILRDLEELSYAEIADLLQLEVGTVKSRINRGRQLLKKRLQGLL